MYYRAVQTHSWWGAAVTASSINSHVKGLLVKLTSAAPNGELNYHLLFKNELLQVCTNSELTRVREHQMLSLPDVFLLLSD